MRPRTHIQSRSKRWGRYLKIAGEAGTIAMSLREKPRVLDWLGVAMRAVGIVLNVREERRRAESQDAWNYFNRLGDTEWIEVPEEFRRLVMEHVSEPEVDETYWDGEENSSFLCRGKIDGELIAWVGEGQQIVDGPYVQTARAAEAYRALGVRLWRRLGGEHLHYGTSGLVLDPFVGNGVLATAQMTQLQVRMKSFLTANEPRSYLLAGPPGTGKSITIRWLIDSLRLTSVRIDLAVLSRLHGSNSPTLSTSLETMLRVLRPRAMILDDLDRVAVTAPLLAFLELALRTCMVVVASANSVSKMMGAALRPGRFDDIIRVDRLDPDVLRTLLAGDIDLFDRFVALPAAYVVEFAKRRRVLGRDQALVELTELVNRSQQIATSSDTDQE